MKKNNQRKYKNLFLGRGKSYCKHYNSAKMFAETVIISMLEFLIDNIFAMFDGRVFQQIVAISMGTNCAPLLASLFLYSYTADFIQGLLNENERNISRSIL